MYNKYESTFVPSPRAESVLRSGRIIDGTETPHEMVERVVDALAVEDLGFTGDRTKTERFSSTIGEAMDRGEVVMSTPIMTNAGRFLDRPLTACTVPTTDLRQFDPADLRREITLLHEQGMGTGFNLDDTANPTEMLRLLNTFAKDSAESGKEDRPVGNMAVLSVYHPDILNFIGAKVDSSRTGDDWKFNISVDIDSHFVDQLDADGKITLNDGRQIKAQVIFDEICAAATVCADPGLVFLDRMNARNPLPGLGEYRTTAPCAEVGLIEGETCQFGYINVGKFVKRDGTQIYVDYERLQSVTCAMMRALDNALEISSRQFMTVRSQYVAEQKRKVGIGLCGVADALSLVGLPYDSLEARLFMQDVLSFVNFASKKESIHLAEERGSCGAMNDPLLGNRHLSSTPHIEQLYADKTSNTVSSGDWRDIAARIASTKLLRNITTVALPPTGRSALVIDASTGIEPHFSLSQANETVLSAVRQDLARVASEEQITDIVRNGYTAPSSMTDPEILLILASAKTIRPMGHIAMAAALQEHTDEAISKTINLPMGTTPEQVSDIYLAAHKSGMSGVTVYVDGTHSLQPKETK